MAPLSMSVLAGPIAGHRVEAARLAIGSEDDNDGAV